MYGGACQAVLFLNNYFLSVSIDLSLQTHNTDLTTNHLKKVSPKIRKMDISSMLSKLPYILGAWILLFILAILLGKGFKRVAKGLKYDLMDLFFSFLDNLLHIIPGIGTGLAYFDVGDLLAAIAIYKHERFIVGKFWASLLAWEASNFFPLNLIPILGETVEFITGLFPAAFFLRLTGANKFNPAVKSERILKKNLKAADQIRIKAGQVKDILRKADDLLKKERPIPALDKIHKAEHKLYPKLDNWVQRAGDVVKNTIRQIANSDKQVPDFFPDYITDIDIPMELTMFLKDAVKESLKLVDDATHSAHKKDYDSAITSLARANAALEQGIEKFNSALDEYANESGFLQSG